MGEADFYTPPSGFKGSAVGMWRPASECPIDSAALLLIGESIPDLPDIRVGTRISGDSAEEIGYREYAKYGGWLIWNDGADFYVIDIDAPRGWMPIPGLGQA